MYTKWSLNGISNHFKTYLGVILCTLCENSKIGLHDMFLGSLKLSATPSDRLPGQAAKVSIATTGCAGGRLSHEMIGSRIEMILHCED